MLSEPPKAVKGEGSGLRRVSLATPGQRETVTEACQVQYEVTYEALSEAYAYVNRMVPAADAYDGQSPLWHGWALRCAFLAGMKAATKPEAITHLGDASRAAIAACVLSDPGSEAEE